MPQSFVIIMSLVCAVSVLGCIRSMSVDTSYLCDSALFESRPNHIKRVCLALENSHDLTNQINSYLKSQESGKLNKPYIKTNNRDTHVN